MNTYLITPKNEEFIGEALIAANHPKEAIDLFKASDEWNNACFTDMNIDCKLVPKLSYDTDTSRIITDCIGTRYFA